MARPRKVAEEPKKNVSESPEPSSVKISELLPMDNGNFGIFIDGEVFGVISACKKASFVVGDQVYGAGKHKIGKYDVEVKDLELDFYPSEPKYTDQNEKARKELMGRVVVK